MVRIFFRRLALLCLTSLTASLGQAQALRLTPDHADGVYDVGQAIRWRAEADGDQATNTFKFSIRQGGLKEIASGTLRLTNGVGWLEAKLEEPGTLLAEVRPVTGGQRALGGAVAAPRKIGLSAKRPADFDEFWDAKVKELQAVPANPQLEPGESGRTGVDYWKITMDNIHGSHIHEQLARPQAGQKLPALLIVQWAGVYPLQKGWAVERANHGWLVLNIEAHDLPIDQPQSFYTEQNSVPLKNYWAAGNDDREASYFLRMYLSCYRAAQYLTERPD